MPRLVQITDTHIYADAESRFDGMDTRASLAAVLAALAARHAAPAALLVTGDLSMDGSAAAYRHLAQALAGITAPLLCVPGNHDEPAVLAEQAPALARALPCALVIDGWRLLCFDTRIAGEPGGALGSAQLAWLAAALAADGSTPTGLVLHHPPSAIDSPWMDAMGLADRAALWDCCAGHRQLRFMLAGHVHQNHDSYRAGVRVMTTPSTCVQFEPRARHFAIDRRAPGYRVLDLHADGTLASWVERVPF